jgi:hypothetical protein
MKTEILVSSFGRTKTQSKYFGKCWKEDRKTVQKTGSKRILNRRESCNRPITNQESGRITKLTRSLNSCRENQQVLPFIARWKDPERGRNLKEITAK